MNGTLEFNVERINKGKENGNFILHLVYEREVKTKLGIERARLKVCKSVKETELKEGDSVSIKMADYTINTSTYIELDDDGNEVTRRSNWLHLKPAEGQEEPLSVPQESESELVEA